jgi:hypothetical protein
MPWQGKTLSFHVSVLESQTFFEVQSELLAVNPHSLADMPGFEPNSFHRVSLSSSIYIITQSYAF